MFGGKYKSDARVTTLENQTHNLENDLNAIKSNMGFIEFTPVGEILEANDLFLALIGYKREEVQGQHHRILCERNYASSQEYLSFWEALRAGDAQRGTFRRVGKNGQIIWLEASYFPVLDGGRVTKVIKIASDITAARSALLDRNALFDA